MNNIDLTLNNKKFIAQFESSSLMNLIRSQHMDSIDNRQKLLDCIQIFSNYFQKIVMLRYVFCENNLFFQSSRQHLLEEFDHNYLLQNDRLNKKNIWDPVLEACSSWFTWKMFTSDNDEKIVIVNLVLESSANIFFQEAHKVMSKFQETEYFAKHAELDQAHEELGLELLDNLSDKKLSQMATLQSQAWDILITLCNRIAKIVLNNEIKSVNNIHQHIAEPA